MTGMRRAGALRTASRDGAARRRGVRLQIGAVLVSLAAGAGACTSDGVAGPSDGAVVSTTTSSPAFGSSGNSPMPIEPGTHRMPRSAWSVVDFTVAFPAGWTEQYGHVFSKHTDQAAEFGFYAVVVDEIFTDPCVGEGVPTPVGSSVEDLVTALLSQPGAVKDAPTAATLGGLPATKVGLTVPEGLDLSTCRLAQDGVEGLQIWYARPADKYFVLVPDMVADVYVLDVDGRRQVFLTHHRRSSSPGDLAELQDVLESVDLDVRSTG